MDALLLIAGFALPWALGVALLLALPAAAGAGDEPGALPWQLGCGWFVGAFALTLWMRALSGLGVPFGMLSIGAPLCVLTAAAGAIAWRSSDRRFGGALRAIGRALAGTDLTGWRRAAWLALLAWIALRFCLLLAEVWWRPLYPWDAWTQWATKARTWFELKRLVPFADAAEFFRSPDAGVYFDAAPHYPATVPLFQVWAATLIGRWDDARINLPWWITGVAFGLAIYGFLRQARFAALPALLGTWLVLSLPILEVHIALAGYADLPMAAYFTLGTVALLRALADARRARRRAGSAAARRVHVVKNPGIIWVLTLIPGVIVALVPRYGMRIAALCFAAVTALTLVLARSVVPILGYRLHLEFDLPVGALFDAYFAFGNWNLLWYGVIAALVIGWRQVLAPELAPLTVVVAAGVSFLLFGFAFTNAGRWVEDQTTVNRATLHLAPLLVVWMLHLFRLWTAHAAPPAAAPAVNSGADV